MHRSDRRARPVGAQPDVLDAWLFTVPVVRAGVPEPLPYSVILERLTRLAPGLFTPQERLTFAVRAAVRQGKYADRRHLN